MGPMHTWYYCFHELWNIHSQDYSFPWWKFCSRERMVHGPFVTWTVHSLEFNFVPGTVRSRELSFLGTNKPWTLHSADHSFTGTFVPNYITSCKTSVMFVILVLQITKRLRQEAQLMLTTGSTRLAVSRGQQTWYHFRSVATFR